MVRTSNDRSTRVRARADSRRLEILRAAARVFRRRGFAGAGMREIAEEAGLSPGNLYHYFRGKDEILYFCQDRALDRMHGALEEALNGPGPVGVRLRAVAAAHVRCLLDELEGSAAHLEVEALPPDRRQRIVERRDAYERGLRRLVAAGVREGTLVPCDPALVVRAMLGALNWTARWYRPGGGHSPASVAEHLADYLARGLEAGTPGTPGTAPEGAVPSGAVPDGGRA